MESARDILKKLGIEKGQTGATRSAESYRCPTCKDTGWLYQSSDGRTDYSHVIPCQCRVKDEERVKILRMIRICELPDGTEGFTFENFIARDGLGEAVRLARLLAEEKKDRRGQVKWLTFSGFVDTGKTHLAVAICRRWLARGRPAKYAYVPLLLNELRKGFNATGDESYDYRFKVYCTIPLLVLDDLGVERGTDFAREQLDTIIDYRAVNGLHLVVTTNYAPEDLPIRIASRLQRVPFGRIVKLDVPEFRLYRGRSQE